MIRAVKALEAETFGRIGDGEPAVPGHGFLAFEHEAEPHGRDSRPDGAAYDTRMRQPSPQELARAGKAIALGVALGAFLLVVGRRA